MLASALALVISAAAPIAPAMTPGNYELVEEVAGERSVPIAGDVAAGTTSFAFVHVTAADDAGRVFVADETTCILLTASEFYRGKATPATIRSRPVQRYQLVIDGDRVHADIPTVRLGFDGPRIDDDTHATDPDGDGKKGAAFDVDAMIFGNITMEIQALWQLSFDGTFDGHEVKGPLHAVVVERALSGLPFGDLGPLRVDPLRTRFRLFRLPDDAKGCDAVH